MITSIRFIYTLFGLLAFCLLPLESSGQYVPVQHRIPAKGQIPVSEAGSYGIPGATYVLVNDITGKGSTLFLGKDVTLDLNGYTITYTDGNYEHVPNGSFEERLKGWDLTKAPSARIEDTKVHVFIGNNILSLQAGEEITSTYINLPVPDRSYFTMCGVATLDMRVSVYVEDDKGTSLKCITKYADSTMISCPMENRSPRLGGGFVYAHLTGLPAGKYRIRVRAETDCMVDYLDIRPAMDSGIGIVEDTHPMGHNDHLYNRAHCAFFDYTADVVQKTPVPGIPRVNGSGTIVIKNGVIRNATPCVLSWGIQSTAENVHWAEWKGCVAENILFESNNIMGDVFGIDATDQPHSYSVYWTLTVKVADKNGKVIKDAAVKILDKSGEEVVNQKTSDEGTIEVQLPEYSFSNSERNYSSPYKVMVGGKKQEVSLDKNREVTFLNK